MSQQTFVMVKPDGLQRGLVGEIISRFEHKGLKLIALKLMNFERSKAEQHYEMHKGKVFFDSLVDFVTSGPIVAMVWEGIDAVQLVRNITGATKALDAQPGTIRGDFSCSTQRNVIHSSDSIDNARREIELFFAPAEMIRYDKIVNRWVGIQI